MRFPKPIIIPELTNKRELTKHFGQSLVGALMLSQGEGLFLYADRADVICLAGPCVSYDRTF